MHLKSLEISGFKSFGKKVNLEFKSPITAIVGPNGSGKSNVAEAFRFVLGEQSIKSLRGKKGEDLIFNGGKNSPKQNRAGVKVVFDNTKRILNLDFDEVSIERVVHRDGINEYKINGSPARLKDIVELLAGAHIGSTGHHIISQGEADKILSANIRERREMIEDALGLKIYHYKKEESQRKLEKTEENIKSVESLRREIAPHIKFLEKQVEKIEKAEEMKQRLKSLYLEYLKRESLYVEYSKRMLTEEKYEPLNRRETIEKELDKARATLAESKTADNKSADVLSLENKVKSTRHAKESVTRDIGRLEGSLSALERTLQKQKEMLERGEHKAVPLKDIETFEKEFRASVEEADTAEDLPAMKRILTALREKLHHFIRRYQDDIDTSSLDDTKKEIEKLISEKKTAEQELQALISDETTYSKQSDALKKDIEEEKDLNRDAEKNLFRLMAEQNEVVGILHALESRDERIRIEEEDFKRELGEASAMIGRDVLQYETLKIMAENGEELAPQAVALEERRAQEERRKAIEKIKIRLEDSGIGAGDDILKEYKEAEERDVFLSREIEDLHTTADSLQTLITELEEKLDIEFKVGIEKINHQFNSFFSLMFGGGSALLHVVKEKKRKRSDDEFELEMPIEEEENEGIDIDVSLPHKRTKGLVMLSGGERALTSIALLFAISQVNPPPFIILDETDAALDEANSRKYGDMIENLSKYSQLILITHNRETMSRAGILYGVTMTAEAISKILSIEFDQAVQVAK
jgi:chromosome segregation protein